MKNKIDKNLLRVISFMLVLTLIMWYFSFNVLTSTKSKEYRFPTRNMYFQTIKGEDKDTVDVLFVGDSSMMYAVNPIQLWDDEKITSFILSYTMMRPYEAYFDIHKTFKTQSPKVLFLETSFLVDAFDKDNDFSTRKVKSVMDYCEFQITGGIDYVLPVMKYRNTIAKVRPSDFIKKHPQAIDSAFKGYNYESIKKKTKIKPIDDSDKVIEYIDCGDIYFDKIYNLCQKNNCELVLLTVPHIGYWSSAKHDKITELAEKYNVKYVDYNENVKSIRPKFSWKTDSKDGGYHLNYSGATKLTKTIEKYLVKDLKVEPTQLTESEVEQWNNDSQSFYKSIEKTGA